MSQKKSLFRLVITGNAWAIKEIPIEKTLKNIIGVGIWNHEPWKNEVLVSAMSGINVRLGQVNLIWLNFFVWHAVPFPRIGKFPNLI